MFPEKFSTDYIDDGMSDFLLELNGDSMLKDFEGGIARLTQRESECLQAFLKNKTCKEIAQVLKIAPRTAELHIHNIKSKLKVNYRNQLIGVCRSNFISG